MLRYREKSSCGAFVAWGKSFEYIYDPSKNTLEVIDTKHKHSIFCIDYCARLSHLPLNFISLLEKAMQIQALTFSNGVSVDLNDIYDGVQLASFVARASRLSNYSLNLMRSHYRGFCSAFSKYHNLRDLSMCRFESSLNTPQYFRIAVQSKNYTRCVVTSERLCDALSLVSHKIKSYMVPEEYEKNLYTSAQALLNTAEDFSTLAKILDERYVPSGRKRKNTFTLFNMKNLASAKKLFNYSAL